MTSFNPNPSPSYARASLEGLPPSIKREIMLQLAHLPSLRRLKLASREFYLVAMAYPQQLRKHYIDQLRKHYTDQLPKHYTDQLCGRSRRDPSLYLRVWRDAEQPRTRWLPECNVAFSRAVQDWQSLVSSGHTSYKIWHIPGSQGFRLGMMDYIAARLYILTGEHFQRKAISRHVRSLTNAFTRRYERMELALGDVELSKILLVLGQRHRFLVDAAAKLETLRLEYISVEGQAGATFGEAMQQRAKKENYEFLTGLLKADDHLTRSVLVWLEVNKTVKRVGGKWRSIKRQ